MLCLRARCWGPFSLSCTPHLSLTSLQPFCKPSTFRRWHTAPEIRPSRWNRTLCMRRCHQSMDDRKSTQTQQRQTEALLFSFFSSSKPAAISLPNSITLGCHNIPFSDSAGNLGFILDLELSMKKHVIKICQTAYFKLKHIQSADLSLKMQPKLCYLLHPLAAWLL